MATHTENKARRREQILTAAKQLIAEAEDGDFSMEALAQTAGVAVVTPYKLFGSKGQVIGALHDWETGRFRARIGALEEPDPILMLLRSLDEAMNLHLSEAAYFKALSREAFVAGRPVRAASRSGLRRFFLENLVAISKAQLVNTRFNVHLLASVLESFYLACTTEWAIGRLRSDELRPRMAHGIGLILLGVVASSYRARLTALVLENQTALELMAAERTDFPRSA
jgi:AcrR family transcriptional regulator